MDKNDAKEWNYLPASMPPESRNVLLAIAHHADSFMRRFAIGSWSSAWTTINGDPVWSIDGMDRNFNEWGWYLVAWMPLPEFPELPSSP